MVESTLYKASPSMYRNYPVAFVIAVILIVAYGLGLVVLLFWWLKCLCTTLTITEKRTILRTGILSKNTNEVWHRDVRNIKVSQGVLQRMFGVGTVSISSAGQADIEISVSGILRPEKVRNLIDQYRDI